MRSIYLLASRMPTLSESVCQAVSGLKTGEALRCDASRLGRPHAEGMACRALRGTPCNQAVHVDYLHVQKYPPTSLRGASGEP
jgi:hypothetical protein